MEQFQENWKKVEDLLQERFGKVPDLEGILFLIGINELGMLPRSYKFSKEQKQDLMHIAVCTLLSQEGYFSFSGKDDDGWPHFIVQKPIDISGIMDQELLLKRCIIRYFLSDQTNA